MQRSLRLMATVGCFVALSASTLYAGETRGLTADADPDTRFAAQADMRNFAHPILTLSNEKGDGVVEIEVVALDEQDHQHRRHTVLLEAGGSSLLGLDSLSGFDRLVLNGNGEFSASLEDAADGKVQDLAVSASNGNVLAGAAKASTQCDGTWNLTCISSGCTYVSGYKAGRVENGDEVYWNLHTPTGPWTTVGSGCATTWYGIQPNGCPSYANNCWGQTFSIDHNLPLQGPDLVITSVSLSTSSVTSGDDVVVYYTVKNIGDVTVTARYQEDFYLQPSNGTSPHTSSTNGTDLAPGQSINLAETVTISAAPGFYSLVVKADSGNAVAESNENNNTNSTPITVTVPPYGQITIHDLIYNPGSGNGWTFALENCPQGSPCVRNFELESTGSTSVLVAITDNSDYLTTVSDDCPTYLPVGDSCYITIEYTLPPWGAMRMGGELSVAYATPSQSSYEICISDDATLCH